MAASHVGCVAGCAHGQVDAKTTWIDAPRMNHTEVASPGLMAATSSARYAVGVFALLAGAVFAAEAALPAEP